MTKNKQLAYIKKHRSKHAVKSGKHLYELMKIDYIRWFKRKTNTLNFDHSNFYEISINIYLNIYSTEEVLEHINSKQLYYKLLFDGK